MNAWLASPYRAIGIYIGGVNRGCAQPNLTKEWVAAQAAAGWRFFPLYVGPQAHCSLKVWNGTIDPAQAASLGRSAADDAVTRARDLGLPRESTIFYDMEDYTGDADCTAAVNTFISAWTARLHDHGYYSGFYSRIASRGLVDQVDAYQSPTHVRPDYLDFGLWDGVQTLSDRELPEPYWMPKRRMKQYQGDHLETWGGVQLNIDSDYLDLAPMPATAFGDFTGNGWSDVVYREPSTGRAYVYGGNGTTLGGRLSLGAGWNGMDVMLRAGNFNRSGGEDILAREKSTGYLWLYPGTGSGLGSRVKLAAGWAGFREITPVGDYNRDGYQDLVAVQASTGAMYLYPGTGGGAFKTRVYLGAGWNGMDELNGGGDFNADGYPDLLAREKSTGNLWLYPGRSGAFITRTNTGTGWNSVRDLVQVGDFDRDGQPDLVAVQKSTGALLHYVWGGNTWWIPPTRIGSGFGSMQPIL